MHLLVMMAGWGHDQVKAKGRVKETRYLEHGRQQTWISVVDSLSTFPDYLDMSLYVIFSVVAPMW